VCGCAKQNYQQGWGNEGRDGKVEASHEFWSGKGEGCSRRDGRERGREGEVVGRKKEPCC